MAALSVQDSNCVIHRLNSVFVSGKQGGRPRCVAFLTANISPEKANVELVFRKFIGLDRAIREDLRRRFQLEGIPPDKTVFHFIPMPLQTIQNLSQEDLELSISKDGTGNYYFPLVKSLSLVIKHVDSSEELSEKENDLLNQTVKPVLKKYFPEVEEPSESNEYQPEAVTVARRKRRAEKKEVNETSCSSQQLLAVAMLGLVVSSIALQALSHF